MSWWECGGEGIWRVRGGGLVLIFGLVGRIGVCFFFCFGLRSVQYWAVVIRIP